MPLKLICIESELIYALETVVYVFVSETDTYAFETEKHVSRTYYVILN